MKVLNRGLLPDGWNNERITKGTHPIEWCIFLGIIFGYFFLNILLSEDRKEPEVGDIPTVHIKCINDDVEFTEQKLSQYIQDLGIPYPHIVLAQAKLETGHFTSKIFKENNNLFGMKKAYSRPSTSIAVNRGHAKYKNWKDSVLDFALYKAYVARDLTEEEYYALLGSSYAEDPLYTDKVKLIANQVLREWTYLYN